MACIITVKGVEYTEEEFAELIKREGIRALIPQQGPISSAAARIINRYDVENKKESVSELWARLEIEKRAVDSITDEVKEAIMRTGVEENEAVNIYAAYLMTIEDEAGTKAYINKASDIEAIANFSKNPTKSLLTQQQVDNELNAEGQLTDFDTQEQIRYNTYSGMSITGISAWSGKQFGYLFDTTPIDTIVNTKNGKIIDVDSYAFRNLMASYGLDPDNHTVERLMEKAPEYKVHSRQAPELESQYVIKVDGRVLDRFVRESWQKDAQIAETIDMITNLAIDNVKMQKLHLLGITNNNASYFFTMVGLGIPLNEVSKIFKTPGIASISEGYRWTSNSLNKNIEDTLGQMLALNNNSVWDDAKWQEALAPYNLDQNVIAQILSYKGDIKNAPFDLVGISTKVLDDIYTGKASEETALVTNLILYAAMKKINPVAQELFDHAQIYSLLKDLPSKKWKLDSILGKIEMHSEFENEADQKVAATAALMTAMRESFRQNSDRYKILEGQDPRQAEAFLEKEISNFVSANPELMYTAENIVRNNLVNRILRRTVSRKVRPGQSVMKNSVVLNLPHVKAAYRVALQLRSILENAFYVYNPTVQTFIKDVVNKTNIFSAFDSLEKIDLVSKEFLKFISSDLTFDLNGETFTTSVDPKEQYTSSSNVTVYGKEAWKQKFTESVLDAKAKYPDNLFLAAIEIKTTKKTNLSYLQISADKLNDERYLEQIRESFLELTTSPEFNNEEFNGNNFSRDMFKYALIGDSMFFSKTGFSLIFPPEWDVTFSKAQDTRFSSLIPINSFSTDVNLARMKNTFLYQFMRANPDLISRMSKPIPASTTDYDGRKVNVYSGEALFNGKSINYDFQFGVPYSENLPKFVRVFDDPIYMLLTTPGSQTSFYIQISSGVNTPSYDFDFNRVNKTFDLDLLATPQERIVNLADIKQNSFSQKKSGIRLSPGQIIGAFDKQGGNPTEIVYFEVKSVVESPNGLSYTVRPYIDEQTGNQKKLSLLKERFDRSTLVTAQDLFSNERTGITHILNSLAQVRKDLRGKELANSAFITKEDVQGKLDLPFYDIEEELTEEEQTVIIDETARILKDLGKNMNIYVQADIFSHLLDTNPDLAQSLSQVLYQYTGYVDTVFDPAKIEPKAASMANNAIKRLQLNVGTLDSTIEITKNKIPIPREGIANIFSLNEELSSIGTQDQYERYLASVFPKSQLNDIFYRGTSGTATNKNSKKLGRFFARTAKDAEFYSVVYTGDEFVDSMLTGIVKEYGRNASESDIRNYVLNFWNNAEKIKAQNEGKEFTPLSPQSVEKEVVQYKEQLSKQGEVRAAVLNIKEPVFLPVKEWFDNYNKPSKLKEKGGDGIVFSGGVQQDNRVYDNGEDQIVVYRDSQIHYLGSEEDIAGFKDFVANQDAEADKFFEMKVPTSSPLAKVEVGSLLWSGGGQYYYVRGSKRAVNNIKSFSLVPFNEEIFSKIEESIISIEELERIVNEVKQC